MQSFAFLSLLGVAAAHFAVEYPIWRGDSFAEGASQWSFPCANITELPPNSTNRTQWPTTTGSLRLDVHHPWALTYVNLGLGTNVTAFNISLISNFNQTGNGTFCLKETGRANLEAGLRTAGLSVESLDGQRATLQVVQIASTGASLFNCADITFNASAALLPDNECSNSTGVGGVAIQNADAAGTPSQSAGQPQGTGAAGILKPAVGGSVLAGLVGIAAALL